MKYTLSRLIKSLDYLHEDLPVVLSQSEMPTCFVFKYDTKIHLNIKKAEEVPTITTVKSLKKLAKDFAATRLKDEKCFLRKSIHISRTENGRVIDYVVKSLELVIGQDKQGNDQGYVYLVLDEV